MQKISYFIILLILLILQGKTISQPTLEWEARYTNGDAKAMALDKFGSIYVTGIKTDSNGGNYDYCTIKYNNSGQQLWTQTYNGPNNLNDVANAIAVDDSGNVYVTGESFIGYVGKNADWDYVTIKYNTNGIQQWIKTYNTPPNRQDGAFSICLDENANVYITGGGGGAYVTIKYDRNGIQQWLEQYIGTGGENKANKVIYKNGFVYVTGYSTGGGSYWDYATIKYNAFNGSQLWVARYNGTASQNDEACCVAVDDTGSVFVGGSSVGIGTNWDFVTIKYNLAGNQQWVNRSSFDSSFGQTMTGLIIDNLSNVYITGSNSGDFLTIKYNSLGTQQWLNNYNSGPSQNDNPNSISLDKQNNVYVTGRSQYPPPIRTNIVAIKYISNGNQDWLINYNSPFSRDDIGNVVLVDSLFNLYIAGKSGSGSTTDFIILKYTQVTGIQQINEIANWFELYQNYPNPFNAGTVIKFTLPEKTYVKLIVYDVLGNNVADLINNELSLGTYQIYFDASKLSSGIYFYRLTTNQNTVSKKLILIK